MDVGIPSSATRKQFASAQDPQGGQRMDERSSLGLTSMRTFRMVRTGGMVLDRPFGQGIVLPPRPDRKSQASKVSHCSTIPEQAIT